jgi:uncharacterized membrane-anchored protein YhcB (DUF1043 family)
MTLQALVLWMPAIVILVAGIFFAFTVLPLTPREKRADVEDIPREMATIEVREAARIRKIVDGLDQDARQLRQISDHIEAAPRAHTAS